MRMKIYDDGFGNKVSPKIWKGAIEIVAQNINDLNDEETILLTPKMMRELADYIEFVHNVKEVRQ